MNIENVYKRNMRSYNTSVKSYVKESELTEQDREKCFFESNIWLCHASFSAEGNLRLYTLAKYFIHHAPDGPVQVFTFTGQQQSFLQKINLNKRINDIKKYLHSLN